MNFLFPKRYKAHYSPSRFSARSRIPFELCFEDCMILRAATRQLPGLETRHGV